MTAIDLLHTRNSHAKLESPAPSGEVLEQILQAGLRAPDHGRLRPWHFLTISGERRAALGEVFETSQRLAGVTDPAKLEKARCAPLRAPLLIVGLLKPKAHPKVPRSEQAVAVGCALHGMSLAAEALGYGAMWRTGSYATDPTVIAALGGEPGDEVVGFLYLGTKMGAAKPLPNIATDDYVASW
jgi:nitroreductase